MEKILSSSLKIENWHRGGTNQNRFQEEGTGGLADQVPGSILISTSRFPTQSPEAIEEVALFLVQLPMAFQDHEFSTLECNSTRGEAWEVH